MNVYDHSYKFNAVKPVITIGAFDGVHLGHIEILKRLKQIAQYISGEATVVTFWPHPRHVLHGNQSLKLLNTLEEKKALLQHQGIENLIILPFSNDFSQLTAHEFTQKYLVKQFGIRHFLLGFNHRIGRDREGSFEVIREYAKEFGFDATQVEAKLVDSEKVSSTKIRNALAEGNVEHANNLLGYNYFLSGTVAKGKQLGRTIGFPTANIRVKEDYKLIPKDGVYAVWVKVGDSKHQGMLNIGYRPTIDSEIHSKTLEVNILNFEGDIYNQHISIEFVHRLRDETKFSGLEALKQQLANDKMQVMKLLSLK